LVSSLERFTVSLITTNSRLRRYYAMFIQPPTFRRTLPPQPRGSEQDGVMLTSWEHFGACA